MLNYLNLGVAPYDGKAEETTWAASIKDSPLKAKLAEEYEAEYMTPYIAAERGYIDEVILPEETRSKIRSAFEALALKDRKAVGFRAHGNIPL